MPEALERFPKSILLTCCMQPWASVLRPSVYSETFLKKTIASPRGPLRSPRLPLLFPFSGALAAALMGCGELTPADPDPSVRCDEDFNRALEQRPGNRERCRKCGKAYCANGWEW